MDCAWRMATYQVQMCWPMVAKLLTSVLYVVGHRLKIPIKCKCSHFLDRTLGMMGEAMASQNEKLFI